MYSATTPFPVGVPHLVLATLGVCYWAVSVPLMTRQCAQAKQRPLWGQGAGQQKSSTFAQGFLGLTAPVLSSKTNSLATSPLFSAAQFSGFGMCKSPVPFSRLCVKVLVCVSSGGAGSQGHTVCGHHLYAVVGLPGLCGTRTSQHFSQAHESLGNPWQ